MHGDPSPQTLALLLELHARKERADTETQAALDDLARAAVQACDVEGVTVRRVAELLGAGPSTVQEWVARGRRLTHSEG